MVLLPPGSIAAAMPQWAHDRLGIPLPVPQHANSNSNVNANSMTATATAYQQGYLDGSGYFHSPASHIKSTPRSALSPSQSQSPYVMPAQSVAAGLRQVQESRILRLRRDIAPLLDRAAAAGVGVGCGVATAAAVPNHGALAANPNSNINNNDNHNHKTAACIARAQTSRGAGTRANDVRSYSNPAVASDCSGAALSNHASSLSMTARANTRHLIAAASSLSSPAAAGKGAQALSLGVRVAATGRNRRQIAGARVAAMAREAVLERTAPVPMTHTFPGSQSHVSAEGLAMPPVSASAGTVPAASVVFPIDWASHPLAESSLGPGPATAMSAVYGPDLAGATAKPMPAKVPRARPEPALIKRTKSHRVGNSSASTGGYFVNPLQGNSSG
mgnify:CR=1 FL=1